MSNYSANKHKSTFYYPLHDGAGQLDMLTPRGGDVSVSLVFTDFRVRRALVGECQEQLQSGSAGLLSLSLLLPSPGLKKRDTHMLIPLLPLF